MTHLARLERDALCDTLEQVGPEAPTLCSPWETRDLAAHIVVRDGRPDRSAGIWVPFLAARTEAAMREYAARPWPELVRLLRSGPPSWSPARLPQVDDVVNLVELFVHHEDVLRADAVGPQRVVTERLQRALWVSLKRTGRLSFRRSPVGVRLVVPDHGRAEVHAPTERGAVTLTGQPTELLLVAMGRARVADVEATGSADAVEALMSSKLGMS